MLRFIASFFGAIFSLITLGTFFGALTVLQLLLGTQLLAIIGKLAAAALAMLARSVFALVLGALRPAPNILAEPPVDLVLGVNSFRHSSKLQSQIKLFAGGLKSPPLPQKPMNAG
jgi:hypothetical protein